MRFDCKDLKRALQREEPEYIAALEMHSALCAECREKLRQWREISKAAPALRRGWDSPDLWPRIHQALARESVRAGKNTLKDSRFLFRLPLLGWRAFALGAAVLFISISLGWILWRNFLPEPPRPPIADTERRLLTEQALREIESAEAAYIQSIDKLSKLVDPKLEKGNSPLLISYREKLMIIDSAIAELRASIERNRFNAHLRQELLSIYGEKQRTLQELMR